MSERVPERLGKVMWDRMAEEGCDPPLYRFSRLRVDPVGRFELVHVFILDRRRWVRLWGEDIDDPTRSEFEQGRD